MQTPNLQNKNAVVVGFGLTGKSCLRFLQQQGANVSVLDRDPKVTLPEGVQGAVGKLDKKLLNNADLIVLSPGIDPSQDAIKTAYNRGVEVIGDVELFARFNHKPVIAITGSNGKSTVTCLVTEMLKSAGFAAQMGGNIGTPVLDLLESDADYLVLELSSFQLELTNSLQPLAATILNVSEDHLDRHLSFDAYSNAKKRIYHNATHCIANRDDVNTWPEDYQPRLSFGLSSSPVGYSWDPISRSILVNGEAFLTADQCALSGVHNMLNIQAALACVESLPVSKDAILQAVSQFTGLPHRFELISEANQVRWINDSKATNVGATIAAIDSLASRNSGKLILIAGGDGKNADFSELQPVLLNHVDLVITLGKDGRNIAALKPGSVEVDSLQQAVEFAANLVEQHDVVLLSPACASLDMFKNYQHRGDVFRQAVMEVVS